MLNILSFKQFANLKGRNGMQKKKKDKKKKKKNCATKECK